MAVIQISDQSQPSFWRFLEPATDLVRICQTLSNHWLLLHGRFCTTCFTMSTKYWRVLYIYSIIFLSTYFIPIFFAVSSEDWDSKKTRKVSPTYFFSFREPTYLLEYCQDLIFIIPIIYSVTFFFVKGFILDHNKIKASWSRVLSLLGLIKQCNIYNLILKPTRPTQMYIIIC